MAVNPTPEHSTDRNLMLIAFQDDTAPYAWNVVNASPGDPFPLGEEYGEDEQGSFVDLYNCIVFPGASAEELRAATAWAGHTMEETLVGFSCDASALDLYDVSPIVGFEGVRDWMSHDGPDSPTLADTVSWFKLEQFAHADLSEKLS